MCSASDASGNTAAGSFVVTVNATELAATGGGGLWVMPRALSLLALGGFLLAVAGFTRRYAVAR